VQTLLLLLLLMLSVVAVLVLLLMMMMMMLLMMIVRYLCTSTLHARTHGAFTHPTNSAGLWYNLTADEPVVLGPPAPG
jgi:hypothetical protein